MWVLQHRYTAEMDVFPTSSIYQIGNALQCPLCSHDSVPRDGRMQYQDLEGSMGCSNEQGIVFS